MAESPVIQFVNQPELLPMGCRSSSFRRQSVQFALQDRIATAKNGNVWLLKSFDSFPSKQADTFPVSCNFPWGNGWFPVVGLQKQETSVNAKSFPHCVELVLSRHYASGGLDLLVTGRNGEHIVRC